MTALRQSQRHACRAAWEAGEQRRREEGDLSHSAPRRGRGAGAGCLGLHGAERGSCGCPSTLWGPRNRSSSVLATGQCWAPCPLWCCVTERAQSCGTWGRSGQGKGQNFTKRWWSVPVPSPVPPPVPAKPECWAVTNPPGATPGPLRHVSCTALRARGRLLAARVHVFSMAGRQVTFHESIYEFLSNRKADPLELIK